MNLFYELRRRNVLRVGAAYIVTAWLVIQVVNTILPSFGFGTAVVRYVTIASLIGFVPSLILAWIFEITPEGLKLETNVAPSESITPQTGRKLDRIIIVTLVLGLIYFSLDKFVIAPASEKARIEELAIKIDQAREAGRAEAMLESFGEKSIAVLPFINLSADPEQEYFSDGISEELLNLLAQIPELRVISRSSAFALKGSKISAVEAAEKLNVGHILEGSVRQSGERIRITVQLIEASSNSQLWSDTFDKTMGDIFAIQDDIARMVVNQLKLELLGDSPQSGPVDPTAYNFFLKARYLAHDGSADSTDKAIKLLKQSLDIAPDYAPAWDVLAVAYDNQIVYGLRSMEEGAKLAREATERALEIDPTFAQAHAELAWGAMNYDNNLSGAARHYERALELEPDNIYVLSGAAVLLKVLGRVADAVELEQFIIARDPLNPALYINTGVSFFNLKQWDKAIAMWRTTLRLSPDHVLAHFLISLALKEKGDAEKALEQAGKESVEVLALGGRVIALAALGRQEELDSALTELINEWTSDFPVLVARCLLEAGQTEAAFDKLEDAADRGLGANIEPQDPVYEDIQNEPRWQRLLKRVGKSDEQLAAIHFAVPNISN